MDVVDVPIERYMFSSNTSRHVQPWMRRMRYLILSQDACIHDACGTVGTGPCSFEVEGPLVGLFL